MGIISYREYWVLCNIKRTYLHYDNIIIQIQKKHAFNKEDNTILATTGWAEFDMRRTWRNTWSPRTCPSTTRLPYDLEQLVTCLFWRYSSHCRPSLDPLNITGKYRLTTCVKNPHNPITPLPYRNVHPHHPVYPSQPLCSRGNKYVSLSLLLSNQQWIFINPIT